MELALPILPHPPRPAQTCVWMDAGVLAFRLCDRGFACEHCPFDAAMRRDPRAAAEAAEAESPEGCPAAWAFPADRLYTDSHAWVQTIRDGRLRAGIDAYASRLLHPLRQVRAAEAPPGPRRGDPWCLLTVEGGELPLGLPVSGRIAGWNLALADHPELATAEPYGRGWIAEIEAARPEELDGLLGAAAAREEAVHDARLFRRNIAFHLLSSEAEAESSLEHPSVEAAQRLVGPGPFMKLARRFLH